MYTNIIIIYNVKGVSSYIYYIYIYIIYSCVCIYAYMYSVK